MDTRSSSNCLGSIAADLFDHKVKYKLFATKVWPLLASSRRSRRFSKEVTDPIGLTFGVGGSFWGATGKFITGGSGLCAWSAGRCLAARRQKKKRCVSGAGSWEPAAAWPPPQAN